MFLQSTYKSAWADCYLSNVQNRKLLTRSFIWLVWLVLAWLAGVIAVNSLGYIFAPVGMPFYAEKADAAQHGYWRLALVVHVISGIVSLTAVLGQFSKPLLRRWPAVHRWMGSIYSSSTLYALCPTGFILAWHAKGGWIGISGFMLLGVLTFWFTRRGTQEILKGNTRAHIVWMIRSFAMVSSAITFRLYHLGLEVTDWEYLTNYRTSLWLSVLGNALAAEWCIAKFFRRSSTHNITPHHKIPHHHPGLLDAGSR